MMRRSTTGMVAALMASGLIATGCGATADSGGGSQSASAADAGGGGKRILMIEKIVGLKYFEAAESGAKQAAKELGDDLTIDSPADGTAQQQTQIIQSGMAKRVDGIILSAVDPQATAPAMKQAMNAGIAAMTYDADIQPDSRKAMALQATDQGIGVGLAESICKVVPGCAGPIALEGSTPNDPNVSSWIKYFKQELAKPQYAKLKLVQTVYGGQTASSALSAAKRLMQAKPDLVGIVAPGATEVAGAARAVQDAGKTGKVQVTGLGVPSEMKGYVASGTVKQFVLWNPSDLGYLAVYINHLIANKKLSMTEGEKFKAGKLGERTVGKDGVVLLGPPLVIDKDNIGSLNF